MSTFEPLKEGQEVFLKRPVQIYAKVIGPREGDFGLPDEQVYYAVQLLPLEQHYLSEDLELANQTQLTKSLLDYPNPEPARERAPSGEVAVNPATDNSFLELARETHDLIARRAYGLYEARGFTHGYDAADWLRAVSEVLLNVPADIAETETHLTIHADVPGFSAKDLEIRIASRSLCITGKRRVLAEQTEGRSVHSERRSNRIFRVWNLPCKIDPDRAAASVSDGILEVKLLKAGLGNVVAFHSRAAVA